MAYLCPQFKKKFPQTSQLGRYVYKILIQLLIKIANINLSIDKTNNTKTFLSNQTNEIFLRIKLQTIS